MGTAEPTKLDAAYNDMEKNVDTTYELVTALVAGVNEYLQPNPGIFFYIASSDFCTSNPKRVDFKKINGLSIVPTFSKKFSNSSKNGYDGSVVESERNG